MNERQRPSGSGAADRRRRQEQTRKAQAEAQARRRHTAWWIGGGVVAAAALALVLALTLSGGGGTTSSASSSTTQADTVTTSGSGQPTTAGVTFSTSLPPWPIPADAAPYIAAAGLHAQSGETLQVHYHAHIDIIDNGSAVQVPADIGFVVQNGQAVGLTSLHTHDTSGVVHIESATDVPFTLGQVFTEWGVRLTSNQVGGLTTGNGMVLRAYVNGSPFTGNPATIVLKAHQEIAFWFGPGTTTSPSVPSNYQFPQGD